MKFFISLISLLMLLSCSSQYRAISGCWIQPNVTLTLTSRGKYQYYYQDSDYTYYNSNKFDYFFDKDSVVLYNFYPETVHKKLKNDYWTILKLNSDTLEVYVHKIDTIIDSYRLNTVGDSVETFTRKK